MRQRAGWPVLLSARTGQIVKHGETPTHNGRDGKDLTYIRNIELNPAISLPSIMSNFLNNLTGGGGQGEQGGGTY